MTFMESTENPGTDLLPVGQSLPDSIHNQLPEILNRAGRAVVFAAEEFFFGRIRNHHTRAAYLHAVKQFLA
jgi:integrase/recombinase XerD